MTLAINGHWFDRTATTVKPTAWFKEAVETEMNIDCGYYYAQAQLWSEEVPDAFAGVHSTNGVMLIFDESSGIPESIYTVSEGFSLSRHQTASGSRFRTLDAILGRSMRVFTVPPRSGTSTRSTRGQSRVLTRRSTSR